MLYGIAAATIVAAAQRTGRTGTVVLLAASVLQWMDTTPLRHAVAASLATPAPLPFEMAVWQPVIARHKFVSVLPSFACLESRDVWNRQAAMEVQLLAALSGIPTNTVYAARSQKDCGAERDTPPSIGDNEMRIYLNGSHASSNRWQVGSSGLAECGASADLSICSTILEGAEIRALLNAAMVTAAADIELGATTR
jgi:hypothetical protein